MSSFSKKIAYANFPITKLLINADVITDLLYEKEPYYRHCLELIRFATDMKIKMFISAYSLSEIVKTLEATLEPEVVKQTVKNILIIFEPYSTTQTDIKNGMYAKDMAFEPSVLLSIAKRLKAEYIVSSIYPDELETDCDIRFTTLPPLLVKLL